MKKRGILIFIIGVLVFIISLKLDSGIAAAFRNAKSPIFDSLFSVVTNFGVAMVFLLWVPCIILYRKNKKAVKLLLLTFLISFVLSFLLSYWAWIIYDVLALHFQSLGNNKSNE